MCYIINIIICCIRTKSGNISDVLGYIKNKYAKFVQESKKPEINVMKGLNTSKSNVSFNQFDELFT